MLCITILLPYSIFVQDFFWLRSPCECGGLLATWYSSVLVWLSPPNSTPLPPSSDPTPKSLSLFSFSFPYIPYIYCSFPLRGHADACEDNLLPSSQYTTPLRTSPMCALTRFPPIQQYSSYFYKSSKICPVPCTHLSYIGSAKLLMLLFGLFRRHKYTTR